MMRLLYIIYSKVLAMTAVRSFLQETPQEAAFVLLCVPICGIMENQCLLMLF